jgi:hypothetical protein
VITPVHEPAHPDVQVPAGISVASSRLRSVNLERDVHTAELGPIHVGGRVIDTLSRVAAAIEDPARTRAWSLTGPYGSGKSTLAFLLDVLLGAPGDRREQAEQLLADASPALAQRISGARDLQAPHGFLTAVATARREPIAETLTRALFSCVNRRWPTGKPPRRIAASLKSLGMPDAGSAEYLTALSALSSEGPVLLLIDEFGKTLEYLASRRDADDVRDDMFLLQEIAEVGAGKAGVPLFTLTLQHLSFLDYASRSSALQRREWAKIQGRFEDITYNPDLSDAVQLIRGCLSHANVHGPGRQLIRQHGAAAESAWSRQGLDGILPADAGLFAALYPLHPLTAVAAPLLAAQIGQHDRTLTGFLASDEPHTIQRFLTDKSAASTRQATTVRLPQLYDYFFASGRTTMLASANAGRWIEIDLILSQAHGLRDSDLQILKTVALLNLIDASGALRASPGLVLFALSDPADDDDIARKALLGRLDALVERGFLVYREFSDEYRIWQGTDVDLPARISEIRERCDDHAVVKLLSSHLPGAVVAGRHSQRTGMLRHFITAATDPGTGLVNGPAVDDPADGILIFHFGTKHDLPMIKSPLPAVAGITGNARAVLDAGRELLALNELLSADILDAVARREINERVGQAQTELAVAMAEAFSPTQPATRWYLLGTAGSEYAGQWGDAARNLPLDGRSLAGIVSAACEIAYPHTPHIRNEMLGRHHLTSQGAKARRELLTAMLTHPASARLDIDGYGPERAMYEGVLAYLGLHGPNADDSAAGGAPTRYRFTEPGRDCTLAPAWTALHAALARADKECPADELFRLLMAPPYGVKAGVVPVIVVAALILASDDVAMFEEGTYQPSLTPNLIERLTKAPNRYSVKYVPVNEGQRHIVLGMLATELGVDSIAGHPSASRNPALLAITRELLNHVRSLTSYAARTRRLSAHAVRVREALAAARDPDDLIFTALPIALGLEAIPASGTPDEAVAARYASGLAAALQEINAADAGLRAEVARILAHEFHLPGDLPSLRRTLAARAAGFADSVLEPDLRGFIALALNDSLADEDWLDPVAVRITRAGLASWTDDHPRHFADTARKLASALDRLSHLYRATNHEDDSSENEIQLVTVTSHDGNEERILVHVPRSIRDTAVSLAAKVTEDAEHELGPGGSRILLAALAEALAAARVPTDVNHHIPADR